ncbi:MAG TPA: methyltransferase domain-containing protein [Gemmatimonadaceae bacterium]|nr:methyltransferase domain-containing protein [Gemmatimonadaceae bacterium]
MGDWLVPSRRRGMEILDDPATDARVVRRSLADVSRANALFGGRRAVMQELEQVLANADDVPLTLLDVGTGWGDVAAAARTLARRAGVTLRTIGLESSQALALAVRTPELPIVRGTALALPFRDRSVDVVICSQLLHHFDDEQASALLKELDRVARRCVIVSDLRRSWLAAAGIWLASWPLFFHPVSRHDGVASVLRGYTVPELRMLVRSATGREATTRSRAGFRIASAWSPTEV